MFESEEVFAQSMKTTLLSNPPRFAGIWARTQSREVSELSDCGPYRTAKSPALNPGKRPSMSGMLKVNRVRRVWDIDGFIISFCCIAFQLKPVTPD